MTAALTETVSGRTIPRYRGEPVTHEVRFYGGSVLGAVYQPRGLDARCEACGWHVTIDGGHTIADLTRLARQHAGMEDA